MGGGIAMSFADTGFPVKLLDASRRRGEKGLQRIRDNYSTSVKRGSLTQAADGPAPRADRAGRRLTTRSLAATR